MKTTKLALAFKAAREKHGLISKRENAPVTTPTPDPEKESEAKTPDAPVGATYRVLRTLANVEMRMPSKGFMDRERYGDKPPLRFMSPKTLPNGKTILQHWSWGRYFSLSKGAKPVDEEDPEGKTADGEPEESTDEKKKRKFFIFNIFFYLVALVNFSTNWKNGSFCTGTVEFIEKTTVAGKKVMIMNFRRTGGRPKYRIRFHEDGTGESQIFEDIGVSFEELKYHGVKCRGCGHTFETYKAYTEVEACHRCRRRKNTDSEATKNISGASETPATAASTTVPTSNPTPPKQKASAA